MDEMLESFEYVIRHLVRREQQVRRKLLATPGQHLEDGISRAYGLLTNCRRLSLKELRDAVSLLRLGTLTGLLRWQEDERDMLIALHRLVQDQATEAALAEEQGDPEICLRRARAARSFLNTHPHQFSEIPA
jgi:protein arginine kinase